MSKFNYTEAQQAYLERYSGKTILVKMGGAEMEGDDFSQFTQDITELARQGLRFIISHGGGPQIDRHFANTHPNEKRPKVNGLGITTPEVMKEGVIPAAHEIRNKLEKAFFEASPHFVSQDDIHCELIGGEYGLTARPLGINGLKNDSSITLVGFTGKAEGQTVNVNADSMARLIAQTHGEVNEVIFLTKEGGILDHGGNIVPLMGHEKLGQAIAGNDPSINLEGGMLQKTREIVDILPLIDKVAITKAGLLKAELLGWRGTGTMCANLNKKNWKKPEAWEPGDRTIFRTVMSDMKEDGYFREREDHELESAMSNHHLMQVSNSILGGASLIPHENGWMELGCLWASYIGNGVGKAILDYAKEQGRGRKLFAITRSPKAARAFIGAQFTPAATLAQAITRGDFPATIKKYTHSVEDKEVFTFFSDPAS